MADGAVLRHRRLVLEGDPQPRAVIGAAIPRAREVDDLVALDRAAARICRIGADAGEVVDLDGEDLAGPAHRQARGDAVLARMDVGDEGFEPVGDELDGTPEQQRQRDHRHLVGIDVDLDAVGAADIAADHAHLGLRQVEMAQHDLFHHMRRLGRAMQRELAVGRVEVGEDRARLEADAGVAGEGEGLRHDRIGAGEGLVHRAGIDGPGESEVVAKRGVDRRRAGRQRSLGGRRAAPAPPTRRRSPPAASSASARLSAATATTGSPCQQARSTASGCCGADFMPLRWVSTPTQGV